jgi:hypothetical protein
MFEWNLIVKLECFNTADLEHKYYVIRVFKSVPLIGGTVYFRINIVFLNDIVRIGFHLLQLPHGRPHKGICGAGKRGCCEHVVQKGLAKNNTTGTDNRDFSHFLSPYK